MSPNSNATPSNQSELKKIIDDVIPMCGVLDCEVCENRHIELAKRLESQRTEAKRELLDELIREHEEICGATRTLDKVNRCEYQSIIANKREELSK